VLKRFLYQYFKSLTRNNKLDANSIFKILTAIALLDFCLVSYLFGMNFTKVFHELYPLADPVKYFNGSIVYIILIVFLLQLFFLKRKNNFIKSYLHLPIDRRMVISYILGLELFNVFNLYIVLFTFSFAMVNVLPNYGWLSFTLYILSICLVLGFTGCFTFLVKTLCNKSLLYVLIPTILIIVIIIQKILFQKSFEKITEVLFDNILQRDYLIIILFDLMIIIFTVFVIIVIKLLIYNVFIYRSINDLKFRLKNHAPLKALRNPYFFIELSLVLRNKRVRSILLITIYLIILTYILFLYKTINDTYTLFFWFLCLSGVWGYSYLQYVFSFEGSFFDFISTANFNFHKYLQAKYFSIVLISIIIISTIWPLILIRNLNLHIVASAFLYNIGIGFFITLYSGTLNKTKVDLNSGILFNYQGYNSVQIISMCFAVCLPLVLLVFISSYLTQSYSLIILNILSMVSLLNYKKWFQIISTQLSKRKYANLEGYRQ
jgi:Family of unknown function (DUF5687)